ncbi:hypothetical protein NC661_03255 [Aquibacillus koreensis]|uniref:Uncharacterized protein n=1 Tax=Aquibacillus koreensis TaxID=279446 RepID=A0A9X4AIJ7_9BACI|nr:hypothetical protein [Aquibacillus koreensis]MCT2536534.1 hypothetical protein [Aquibacillus koreensis]MDC3419378.1 hypothetical protein [Aquibacillus koreensis]
MKKYWKSTAIIAVIVLSLGTFFVNAATSAEQYPEFVIQKQSGDASEIKPLVLDGSYADTSSASYVSTNLKISTNGSKYNSRSLIDQIIGQPPTLIKDLQEQYRSFMRGKNAWADVFFEDESFLAYADVDYKRGSLKASDFTFSISVLNKKDGNTNTFTVEVPDSGVLSHIFVEDVQVVGDELHLITQNMMPNYEEYHDEKHVYTIDLADQHITHHESIIQFPKEEGEKDLYINAELIETDPTKANERLVFLTTKEIESDHPESSDFEVMNKEIITYNLATKESEVIDVPDLDLMENQLSFYDGSNIYFTRAEGQEFIVTPFDLENEKNGQLLRIPMSNDENGNVLTPMITVNDDKLYAVDSYMNASTNAAITVSDLKSGDPLFEGEIVLKDSLELDSFDLYVHEIFLR